MYDVPNNYLLQLWNEGRFDGTDGMRVKRYINDNLDAIKNDRRRDRDDPFSVPW